MWELDLARILREILTAGSRRDWDKMIELANELADFARAASKAAKDPGADKYPENGDGRPDENP